MPLRAGLQGIVAKTAQMSDWPGSTGASPPRHSQPVCTAGNPLISTCTPIPFLSPPKEGLASSCTCRHVLEAWALLGHFQEVWPLRASRNSGSFHSRGPSSLRPEWHLVITWPGALGSAVHLNQGISSKGLWVPRSPHSRGSLISAPARATPTSLQKPGAEGREGGASLSCVTKVPTQPAGQARRLLPTFCLNTPTAPQET